MVCSLFPTRIEKGTTVTNLDRRSKGSGRGRGHEWREVVRQMVVDRKKGRLMESNLLKIRRIDFPK